MYFDRPLIERDPVIAKMRTDVFEAIEAIAIKAFPETAIAHNNHDIKFISYEDALKELVALKQTQLV